MTPTAVVFSLGFFPALMLGWVGGIFYERNKRVTTSAPHKRITRDNLLVALVVAALVGAVIAAVYAYVDPNGKDREARNFDCLVAYVTTGQQNNAPATLANRAQSAAWRDYEQGYSTAEDAKSMDKPALKARWLALYKVYEDVQVKPLPDLREFCAERK